MPTETHYCAICGVTGVSAPGLVCQRHLPTSEQELLAGQARKPAAWILGARDETAVRSPTVAKREIGPLTDDAELLLAGFWQRFFAFVIDAITAMVVAIVLAGLATASPAAAQILVWGGWWGYFLLSNSLGRLVGKAMLGIKVIDPVTGREPGLAKGALRTLGQAVTMFLTFGLGFLLMVGDRRKMAVQDYFAGTIVVRTTEAPR